ncbi:MAG: BatA and WFA domain-containing protein [Phycisphaerales bacterium]
MTFLHPAILAAGLLAVAIPILIHFFMRRRRKPIRWAAMRFLMEAYRKRKRRLALEQILLLAARCLLLALLAGAIAHPMIGAARTGSGPPRLLIVVLDDSLTAQAADDAGETELTRSIALAADAVEQLDTARGDTAVLITIGAPARAVIATPSADLASVVRAIESTRPTDAAADIAGAMSIARRLIADDEEADAYVLLASGLHAGVAGARAELAPLSDSDTPVRLTLGAPAAARANIAVSSLVPARRVLTGDEPGGRLVTATLARFGPEASGTRSSVQIIDARTGRTMGSSSIAWSPGETRRTVSIPIEFADESGTPGQRVLRATIGGDALAADDARAAIIETKRTVRVGIIARAREGAIGVGSFTPTDWLRAALDPAGDAEGPKAFDVSVIDPARVDEARLARVDAVVLTEPNALGGDGWRALSSFVQSGGLAIITPPALPGPGAWADAVRDTLGLPWSIRAEAPELERGLATQPATGAKLLGLIDAELEYLAPPVRVTRAVEVSAAIPGDAPPGVELTLDDGSPFALGASPDGARGMVVLLASALDPVWTNLPTRPLFVPLLHELVRQGVGASRSGWESVCGVPAPAPRGTVELTPAFESARTGAQAVQNGLTEAPVRTSGVWQGLDDGGSPRGLVVVNPDASASDTSALGRAAVEEWLGALTPDESVRWIDRDDDDATGASSLAGAFADNDPGSPIAWIALVGALALALFECLIGRRSSHAERIGGAA